MTVLLVGGTMAVGIAALLSLLLYLPALAIVETISPRRPALRALVWLAALLIPPLISLAGAGLGLARSSFHPLLSPHAGAIRSHICIGPWFEGPDGAWRAQLLSVLAAAFIVAALMRLVLGAFNSARLSRLLMETGARLEGDWGQGEVPLYPAPGEGPGVLCVGLWRPVIAVGAVAADRLSAEQLRAAIAHEVAHARRRDNLADLLCAGCVTLVAFAPTAHLYRHYWRREAEQACDRLAAAAAGTGNVAEALQAQVAQAGASGKMPIPQSIAQVQARLSALADLDEADSGGKDSQQTAALALTFAVIAALTLGLAVVVTLPQVMDSLHCAAESLMAALTNP